MQIFGFGPSPGTSGCSFAPEYITANQSSQTQMSVKVLICFICPSLKTAVTSSGLFPRQTVFAKSPERVYMLMVFRFRDASTMRPRSLLKPVREPTMLNETPSSAGTETSFSLSISGVMTVFPATVMNLVCPLPSDLMTRLKTVESFMKIEQNGPP